MTDVVVDMRSRMVNWSILKKAITFFHFWSLEIIVQYKSSSGLVERFKNLVKCQPNLTCVHMALYLFLA